MSNGKRTIDARGFSAAQSAQQVRQVLDQMAGGGTVEVLVNLTAARDDVVRVARQAGWRSQVENKAAGEYKVTLTK